VDRNQPSLLLIPEGLTIEMHHRPKGNPGPFNVEEHDLDAGGVRLAVAAFYRGAPVALRRKTRLAKRTSRARRAANFGIVGERLQTLGATGGPVHIFTLSPVFGLIRYPYASQNRIKSRVKATSSAQ